MSEMWSSRRAANKTSGPGLGVEGRDGPLGVRSHNLTNRTLRFNQLPSGPFLKFSVKSVTIQQTREKLRTFFQEMNQWSTYFFLPQNTNCCFFLSSVSLIIDSWPRSDWEQDWLCLLFTSWDTGAHIGGDIRDSTWKSLPHYWYQEETHWYLRCWGKLSIRQSRQDKSWLVTFALKVIPINFFLSSRE